MEDRSGARGRERAGRVRAAACGIALLLLACSEAGRAPIETSREVLFSLLTRSDARPPDSDASVELRLVWPRMSFHRDSAGLPAAVVPIPGSLSFVLPRDTPPGAELQLALGLDAAAHEGEGGGRVRLEIRLDGGTVLSQEIGWGEEAPRARRRWSRHALAVAAGERLELRAEATSGPPPPDGAAFGLLDVSAPVLRRRTEASRGAPSLVLILIDTLRADRLGCYGSPAGASPHVDALAARGTLFERAYAPSPWTWPSTATLLTGLSPPAHGVLGLPSCFLAHDHLTLAEQLRRAGFATAAISTSPLVDRERNFDQGFEEFHHLIDRERDSGQGLDEADHGVFGTAPEVLALAEPWLRRRAGERFFLYLHLTEPHGPYLPDPALASAWIPERAPEGWRPRRVSQLLRRRTAGEAIDEELLQRCLEHNSALYDGEVATVDHAVGRLLELLRELGRLEETLVVVTSDHGEEFAEHGMSGHGKQLHEESLRVPLIAAGPGVPPGRRVQRAVPLRQLPGSLLARLGVSPGRFPFEGDLWGSDPPEGGPLYFSIQMGRWVEEDGSFGRDQTPVHGVRRGEHLLLWCPARGSSGGALRLYDLGSDPEALADVATRHPDLSEELRRMIAEWLASESARRPEAVPGGATALEMLRGIGYVEVR